MCRHRLQVSTCVDSQSVRVVGQRMFRHTVRTPLRETLYILSRWQSTLNSRIIVSPDGQLTDTQHKNKILSHHGINLPKTLDAKLVTKLNGDSQPTESVSALTKTIHISNHVKFH